MEHPSTSLPHKWLVTPPAWKSESKIDIGNTFSLICHHAPHYDPSTQRHILHHATHMNNSRMFAFPRSASIIALNTAFENVQFHNLDVSNKWATPTRLEHPQRLDLHPRATNLNLIHPSWYIPQSLKMGVVAHAFSKHRCILDVDPLQSSNELPKCNSTNCKAVNEASGCLEDGDMRLQNHGPLPRNSILSTWLALR